jgi:hypothetical protein
MDCDACNNLLLDHLYEELDEARSAAVRDHLKGCDACAEAFDRLALGRRAARSLPVLHAPAPSAALLAAIQATTPAPKLRLVTGSSVAVEASEATRGRFPRWLQRVGEVAMRRQVAMAAVFLLMIGFGLSYNQFQAPTRPLPSSDDPGPMVIPAREVPAPTGPATASARVAENRRSAPRGGTGDRPAEHRLPPPARTLSPVADEAASIPTPTPQIAQPVATGSEPARDDTTDHGAPTAYRNLPTAPPVAVGSVVTAERVSGDPGLDRGMPRLQVAQQSNAVQQGQGVPATQTGNAMEQQALNRAQNQFGSTGTAEGWRGLDQEAEAHRAQGRTDQAIDAWRRALTSDPPAAERATIARRLYNSLVQSGRQREASEVFAMYLMRANNTNELANQVPSNSNSTVTRPAPSRSMPSRAPVQRRAVSPAATDSYSNMGL